MMFLEHLHDRVFDRRIRVLADCLSAELPSNASVLDVGCGDGSLASLVMDARPGLRIEGIDVLVRPSTSIPIRWFDGTHLPYDDHSMDVVMFVDVLHHTDDPLVLIREASRVAKDAVVIKDHLADRFAARPTLRLMDWVGNARHGVRLPYNYWTRAEWHAAFAAAALRVQRWREGIPLYPAPASLVFGGSLQFIGALAPPSGNTRSVGSPDGVAPARGDR